MEKSICQLMNFRQITLQWIEKMLFYDKIRLKDIPTEIRISSADIYIIADLITMENQDLMKSKLLRILSNALKFHDFGENQELVDFQKNMPEILLQQLQTKEQAIQDNIRNQLYK